MLQSAAGSTAPYRQPDVTIRRRLRPSETATRTTAGREARGSPSEGSAEEAAIPPCARLLPLSAKAPIPANRRATLRQKGADIQEAPARAARPRQRCQLDSAGCPLPGAGTVPRVPPALLKARLLRQDPAELRPR